MRSSLRFVSAAAALVAAPALGGCQDNGAAPLGDGDYRLYATSSAGIVPDATLAITGPDVTLAQGSSIAEYALGAPAAAVTGCPPSGKGTPVRVDGPMVIGDLGLQSPALLGDCGQTRPVRVTVVDLESFDEGLRFPFTRWAEFCDITDPDC
jgi:hypothetical protein